jgi:hypothetical protein
MAPTPPQAIGFVSLPSPARRKNLTLLSVSRFMAGKLHFAVLASGFIPIAPRARLILDR